MLDTAIDPRLQDAAQNQPQPQPRAGSASAPPRNADEPDYESDGDGDDDGQKRRKLNLWKCKQCREARKKCFPVDRVWPQKCERCLQHRPDELECSEPELNTRKRGKNLTKPAAPRRAKARSASEKTETTAKESDNDNLMDDVPVKKENPYERPGRSMVVKRIKREHPDSMDTLTETPQPVVAVSKKDQTPAFAYRPLGNREFRVLRLDPGRKDASVVCSFITASINQPPEYEAISYLWGGSSDSIKQSSVVIELRDSQDPPKSHYIFIKSNLYAALRSLRHPEVTRSFWVDALCINHSDLVEKNNQVSMKRHIFHNAVNLCFWLGEDPSYKEALNFIPRILDLASVDKLVRDDKAIDGWVMFTTLLKNTVFSRLWLVQEVAIARNVTLHCGQPAIHYADFVDAVAIFMSCRVDISLLFRRCGKNYKELADRKITMAERFIDVTTNALRKSTSGDIQKKLLSLEALVSQLSDLSSTNPRDRIYSVLALAKDGDTLLGTGQESPREEGSLRIEYDKSILEVYQDFVKHVVTRSQSLDIICRRWASSVTEKEANLPTWIRPLQSSLQPPFDSNISQRTDADSLVGTPDHKCYDASKNTLAAIRIESRYEFNQESRSSFDQIKSLFAAGFHLDTIAKLGPRASEGIILYEWLGLGGCVITDEMDTVPEAFWRTLVADRGPNGSHAPSWYHRAFLYCLAQSTPNGDINTNRLIAECEAGSSLVVHFLQRVQSVIWNRKFLVSKQHGFIGLAPMAAQEGDVIVILNGCSVPVVLRKQRLFAEDFWYVIGECYVHGMMDGEALEIPGGHMEEEFELR